MSLKIGVFDSGVGGITVLSELRLKFPHADYVYLGDTAHVPYGPKSPNQIQRLSIECAKTLKQKNVDLVVVACNTASSWALPEIQETMGTRPVVGVIDSGAQAALDVLHLGLRPVLVLATRATVQSQAYSKALRTQWELSASNTSQPKSNGIKIIEKACPLLVPMIEEGWIDHPILHQTILEYVGQYREPLTQGVALLGCTHYPWIQAAIQKALPGWEIVNSARAVANGLAQNDLFCRESTTASPRTQASGNPKMGKIEWIFTDPDAVPDFAQRLIEQTQQESFR